MDYYIGSIILWAGAYAPRDWLFCDGTELLISQFPQLYAVIRTTYGGDGIEYFNLPNLNGHVPIGTGEVDASLKIQRGGRYGISNCNVEITVDHLPKHTHEITEMKTEQVNLTLKTNFKGTREEGEHVAPEPGDRLGALSDIQGRTSNAYKETLTKSVSLSGVTCTISNSTGEVTGQLKPSGYNSNPLCMNRMQPTLNMRYIIAQAGEFPPKEYD